MNTVRIVVSVLLALAWMGWVLNLIGLSLSQANCMGGGQDATTQAVAGLRGFSAYQDCSGVYRFWWWVMWLEFAVLLAFSIVMCIPSALHKSALGFLAVFSVLTVLLMGMSEAFLSTQGTPYFAQGAAANNARTVAAGAIISAFATLLLAFFLGWKQKKSAAASGPIKY